MSKRSFLFVPGNRPERFDKAWQSGADAVVIDLEDAVAPSDKPAARENVKRWLNPDRASYLRVNGADTEWFSEDLALLSLAGIAGVMLPKAESPAQIHAIAGQCARQLRVIPLIETAIGLWNAESIARAPQIERLAFGSVDFQLDCGIGGEREELLFARSQLVVVSRVAGLLPPVDGVTLDIDDANVLKQDVVRARSLGFSGKLCIHPKQVALVNAGFMPQLAEMRWAEQVMQAVTHCGENAIRLDGKIIDRPVIERARAILAATTI